MQFATPIDGPWIAAFINAEYIGNNLLQATGINEINRVQPGDIVFVDHPKYYDKCIQSSATFIIINKVVPCPSHKVLLVVPNPFEAYDKLVRHFRPATTQSTMIHSSAVIHPTATIYPNVYIGSNVTIGMHTIIYPNTTIYDHTTIGDYVTIHAHVTIGSHAFYYNTKKDRDTWYQPMYNCGNVVIHNHVEVGAGCTIDKGVSSSTIIGAGTKIDNQCHIGHDTILGKNCLLAAKVAIAGATTLEDGVQVWGQVGINKTLTIGANAIIMGQSGVSNSIPGNKVYWGTPVQELNIKRRELVWIKRIPEIWEKIKHL